MTPPPAHHMRQADHACHHEGFDDDIVVTVSAGMTGEVIADLRLQATDTVGCVMGHLQKRCNLPRFQQKLVRGSTVLQPQMALGHLGSPLQLTLAVLPHCKERDVTLLEAARAGDAERLQASLEARANPEHLDGLYTPLHYASMQGSVDMLRMLVDAGVDVEVKDSEGRTPLLCAAGSGSAEVTRLLLEARANPDPDTTTDAKFFTPLAQAAANGHVEILQILWNAGADLHKKSHKGCTPLHVAACMGHEPAVRFLLDASADLEAVMVEPGWTALVGAVRAGQTAAAKALIEAGAQVTDLSGGGTSMHHAAYWGQLEIVRFLCEQRQDLVNKRGAAEGTTPLHKAVDAGYSEICMQLCDARADVNVSSWNHVSPLQAAAKQGNLKIVKILRDAGAAQEKGGSALWTSALRSGKMKAAFHLYVGPSSGAKGLGAASRGGA